LKSNINQDVIDAIEHTIRVKEKPIKILLGSDFTLLRFSGQLEEQWYGTLKSII